MKTNKYNSEMFDDNNDNNNNNEDNDNNSSSLFTINIPSEYRSYIEDLSRMLIINLVANILFNRANPKKFPIFGRDFLMTVLFVIVGVSAYWLVFRRLISFSNKNTGYSKSKFWYGGGY